MSLSKQTRDLEEYLESYLELPFERVTEQFRKREVIRTLENLDTKYLVEIGCGLDSIFNHLKIHVSGVIIEPIRELLDEQKNINSNIIKICSRLESLESKLNEEADTVLISSLLHEIDEPEELLNSAIALLKTRGKIVCVVPNGYSLHRLVGWKKGIIESPDSRTATQDLMQQKQKPFTPDSLNHLFQHVHLEVSECRTFMPKLLSHDQMQNLLDNKIIDYKFIEQLNDLSDLLEPVGSEILIIGTKIK
jgi:SAM-dependent methyltransferase